jgi:ubiquinone/menaquinone biosynthesis C-methylase UbiE
MGKPDLTYSATARAFDAIAPDYDLLYGPEANQVMAWMREENLTILQSTFAPGANLLEIGCGTGDEAVALARIGCRVTATDISPAMVAITREKAAAAGLSEQVKAIVLPAGHLEELQSPNAFDGGFASFGSLNCEPNISDLAASLASFLKKGAFFVCSFMPPISPFELTWFMAHARPVKALRRMNPGWQLSNIAGRDDVQAKVQIRYLSIRDIRRAFSPQFTETRTMSLGLFLPPPYLDELYRKRKRLWQYLAPLEKGLRERRPWNSMGDHVIMVVERS